VRERWIIIDYWGVFRRLQEAFAEFDPEDVCLAVIDLLTLRETFPVRLAEALALVAGLPEAGEYEQMMWLVKYFGDDPTTAERFEERFAAAEAAFEVLAPDAFLAPFLDDFQRLVRLRVL
jgi:type I restriction enzyme, R subunit